MWLDLLRRLRLGGAAGAALAVLDAAAELRPRFVACDAAVAAAVALRKDPAADDLRTSWGELRDASNRLLEGLDALRRSLRR